MRSVKLKVKKGGNEYVYWGIVFSVLYAFLPMIRALPDIVRAVFRVLPLVLCVLGIIKRSCLREITQLLLVLAFSVFNALIRIYSNANGVDIDTSIMGFVVIAMCYWITVPEGVYVARRFSPGSTKTTMKFIIWIATLSSVTTIIGNIINPEITRDSAASSEAINYWLNVGNYGFCLAIGFLVPVVVYMIKKETIKKRYYVNVLLMIMVPICCQIFTSTVITIVGFVLMSGKPQYFKRMLFVVITVCLCWIVVPMSFWGYILKSIANAISVIGIDILHERLDGMAELLIVGSTYGDVYTRFNLYSISLEHFIHNPILGLIGEKGLVRTHSTAYDLIMLGIGADESVGRHSDFIDLLGGGGLVAFIPFVLLIRNFIKKTCKRFNNPSAKTLLFVVFLQYIIYGLVDHAFSNYEVTFCIFVVSILAILAGEKQEGKNV